MTYFKGETFAVGPARDLHSVYSRFIENKRLYTEVATDGRLVCAAWAGDTLPNQDILAISQLFPRVGFGTIWGFPGLFIAYGIYAAGIEEVSSKKRFFTPDEAGRLLEQAHAVVEGHLNLSRFQIVS